MEQSVKIRFGYNKDTGLVSEVRHPDPRRLSGPAAEEDDDEDE